MYTNNHTLHGINFNKKQIKYNVTKFKRNKEDIKYVIVHYTANYSKYADDSMHFRYFDSKYIGASADFFVDCDSITQINDFYQNYTWGVGDGKNKYGINNQNSIHVEICVNKDLDKAIENTIVLFRDHLMVELPHLQLKRHYDASRKLCPLFFVDLNIKGYNEAYANFRNQILNSNKKFDYIINNCSDYPDKWIKAIKTIQEITNPQSDLGDIEILQFTDKIVEKAYQLGRKEIN